MDDLRNNRPGILEADFHRHTPDMLQNRFHKFQQAFDAFLVTELEETAVATGEVQYEVLPEWHMLFS